MKLQSDRCIMHRTNGPVTGYIGLSGNGLSD